MSARPVPRKRFGQHFLCDQAIIQRIVAAISPEPDQHLVEIGPGQGALTIPVLRASKHLDVIELDRDLIPELEKRNQQYGQLNVYSADALTFDFATLRQDQRKLRVIGNLPYNISTPLIFHLLDYANMIVDMTFMLQQEVAKRMRAKASEEDYGRLSVMVQYQCQVEILFDVPPSAFFPPPKVQSSMVRLTPHEQYPCQAKDFSLFSNIVKQAFGKRRKTLRNSLKDVVDDDIWLRSQICSDLRPEELSVKDFVTIANTMCEAK